MIRLVTSYYKDENEERQKEIDECLSFNLNNPHIDEILLLCESLPSIPHPKLKIIESNRPTFKDFLSQINKITGEEDINILSNDIFLDNKRLEIKIDIEQKKVEYNFK